MGSLAASEGHAAPRPADEGVPRFAAVIDHVAAGSKDAVREPVVAQELPDGRGRVRLGRARRRRQGDAVRHTTRPADMGRPASSSVSAA